MARLVNIEKKKDHTHYKDSLDPYNLNNVTKSTSYRKSSGKKSPAYEQPLVTNGLFTVLKMADGILAMRSDCKWRVATPPHKLLKPCNASTDIMK